MAGSTSGAGAAKSGAPTGPASVSNTNTETAPRTGEQKASTTTTAEAQNDELMMGQEGEEAIGEDSEEEEEEEEESQIEVPIEGEAEEEEYESSSQSGTDSLTWISWYCSLPGHEFFAEVTEDFIEDDFNLTGLSQLVPFYKEALEMVLDVEPEEESLKIPDMSIVESSAELLYGLIHQRYIITRQGLQQMVAKYEAAHFGSCPRVYCNQTKVLPSGRSDLPGVDGVKLFCPNCLDTYTPPSSRFNGVDGAFFGTTFPHLLFQQHPELVPVLSTQQPTTTGSGSAPPSASSANSPSMKSPTPSPAPNSCATSSSRPGATSVPGGEDTPTAVESWTTPTSSAAKVYIPRIYGFKVSERARSGPRMQWLRLRPQDPKELERVDNHGRWIVTEQTLSPATGTGTEGGQGTTPLKASKGNAATVQPMAGVQKTPTSANANATGSVDGLAAAPAPAAPAVRQSRSRQKLNTANSAGERAQGGTAASTNNNDDTLPPRKSYSNAPAAAAAAAAAAIAQGGSKGAPSSPSTKA